MAENITATENYQIVQKIATDEYLKLHPETNAAIVKMAAEDAWSLSGHEAATVEEALEFLRQAVEKICKDGVVTGIRGAGEKEEDGYRTGQVTISPTDLGADVEPTEGSKNLMTSGAIYETFKEYLNRTVSDFENYYTKDQIDSIYIGLQQLNIKILKGKDELPATWEDEDGDGKKETPIPTEDAVAYTFYLYPDETEEGEVDDRHIYTMWYCGPVGHGKKLDEDPILEFVYMGESKWALTGYITDDDLKDALDEYDEDIKDYIGKKLQETLDKAESDLTDLKEELYGNGKEGDDAVAGDIPTLQEDVKAAQATADTINERLSNKTKTAAYTAVAINEAGVVIAGGHSIIVEDNEIKGAPTLDDLAIGGIAFIKVAKEG